MINKYTIYAIFSALALVMLGMILSNTHAIKSDAYELLNLQVKPQEKEAIEAIERSISHNVYLLSKDFENLEYFQSLNDTFQIFETINIRADQSLDIAQELKALRLATLDKETLELLRHNAQEFFTNNISELLNGFSLNLLGSSNDLLNLSSHSNALKTNENIRLDISTMRLYTIFNDEIYYVGHATLKEAYDSNLLLEYVKAAKDYAARNNSTLLVNSSALFGAEAKNEGNKEAIFMGGCSFILLILFLFAVFKNIHIFKLVFIVIFSFLCGLCGAIVLLGNVHLLSIVISTSLIGLIMDFAMHFLSSNQSVKIHKGSAKNLKKIFLIALFITSSGYLVFLASPMVFLHQIAIISVCSLCGAFLSTYFLLPYLLENHVFCNSKAFNLALVKLHRAGRWILRFKAMFAVAICAVFITAFVLFTPQKMSDNIKQYSSLPEHLVAESALFSRILQNQLGTQFILLHSLDLSSESALIDRLKSEKLISHSYGLSNMLLNPLQQQEAKDILLHSLANPAIAALYHQVGFSDKSLSKTFKDIQSMPILSIEEAIKSPILRQLQTFTQTQNSIIFVQNPIKNQAFFEILESHNATFVDFIATINESFMEIKQHALVLKICAFVFAFVILSLFFGLRRGSIMTALVLLSTLLSAALLLLCGMVMNIFVIFGLIVASAIGVDYMLFATNRTLTLTQKTQSIVLASLTSVISFVLLVFSTTQAVSSFGASVSLGLALAAVFAILLALSYHKEEL